MAIVTEDVVWAAARVGVTGGVPTFLRNNGFKATIVDNGAGDFTLSLDTELDPLQRATIVTPVNATFASATIVETSDAAIQVLTWDHDGTAEDNVDFNILVLRIGL